MVLILSLNQFSFPSKPHQYRVVRSHPCPLPNLVIRDGRGVFPTLMIEEEEKVFTLIMEVVCPPLLTKVGTINHSNPYQIILSMECPLKLPQMSLSWPKMELLEIEDIIAISLYRIHPSLVFLDHRFYNLNWIFQNGGRCLGHTPPPFLFYTPRLLHSPIKGEILNLFSFLFLFPSRYSLHDLRRWGALHILYLPPLHYYHYHFGIIPLKY